MNANDKKSKPEMKINSKNYMNPNDKNNNKDNNISIYPIKYFCFNEVKKIVNNKNNKNSPENIITKVQQNLKKEEEDYYSQSIYNKRCFNKITNISSINILNHNYKLKDIFEKENYMNNSNSTDERYKAICIFGLKTKKIFKKFKNNKGFINIGNNKFSKKNRKKCKLRNKNRESNTFLDLHEINNINSIDNDVNNRTNNATEYYNNITSNSNMSKTITNNTINNYTISNITSNSCINKSNNNAIKNNIKKETNDKLLNNKKYKKINNNIKVMKNKGRNKNKNDIKNEKEKTVFVRRIVLEEKYTIDSKGSKKTIYLKKLSPSFKINKNINSADKKSNKKYKKKNNINLKDNTFINHNDINFNFNVCPIQKNNFINNNRNTNMSKVEKFDDNPLNINDSSINDTIKRSYKNIFNIKNCSKLIYKYSNMQLNELDRHKSYKSFISSPDKKFIIKIIGNNPDIKKIKKTQNTINNCNQFIILKNKKKTKKNTITKNISNNSPLKYELANSRFLKNKYVYRKTRTNFININSMDNKKLKSDNKKKGGNTNKSLSDKRSFSFVGKNYMTPIIKNLKKIEKKGRDNTNNSPTSHTSYRNKKLNDCMYFSPSYSLIISKNNPKKNSINSSNNNYKKKDKINKSNINVHDGIDKNRCNSSKRIINKKNNFISRDVKLLEKNVNSKILTCYGRHKSHRNFILKKYEKYNLNYIMNNVKKKNMIQKAKHSNIIYLKNKNMKK